MTLNFVDHSLDYQLQFYIKYNGYFITLSFPNLNNKIYLIAGRLSTLVAIEETAIGELRSIIGSSEEVEDSTIGGRVSNFSSFSFDTLYYYYIYHHHYYYYSFILSVLKKPWKI